MLFRNRFSGIDFRHTGIAFASVKMHRQLPVLQHVSVTKLDEHPIAEGRVADKDGLVTQLRRFLRKKDASKNVHLAIPTDQVLMRRITTLPDVGERELANILRYQIKENILLPFPKPTYDFVKIGTTRQKTRMHEMQGDIDDFSVDELTSALEKDMHGSTSDVLLFATSEELSQDLAECCGQAGIKPLSAEVRALALQRLLRFVHPGWLKETEMVMDVSEQFVDLHIFKRERLLFSRSMPIHRESHFGDLPPGSMVNRGTSRTKQEAAAAVEDHDGREATSVRGDRQAGTFDSYLTSLISEVEKAQNFFHYTLGEREEMFKRIIVTGENAERIFAPLAEQMMSEVCRINFLPILHRKFKAGGMFPVNRSRPDTVLDSCSVAIGLAMRAQDKATRK